MNADPETHRAPRLENGFRLEELVIDPRAGDVSGPGGNEKLDPKVMDVLVLLAQHAGQVVLREDLLAQVWPKAVVSDYALSRCIYELRRQLNHAAGNERYKSMLETLPKRGYRLHGKVDALLPPAPAPEPEPAPQASAPAPRRLDPRVLAIAGVLLFAGALWFAASRWTLQEKSTDRVSSLATNSIAVLPFVDMSETRDQGYLSDGIAEEILDRLTRIDGLRVIARTSSFTFRDQRADIREIAAKLNVSHVLEGSVRKSGDRVRITTQLVDASSNSHVWSKTYDRSLGDLFAVQAEIAASVATALDLSLRETTAGSQTAIDAEAHRLFLQGQFFFNRRAHGDVARSAKYYEDALAIDPGYVKAWVALAGAYSILAESGEVPRSVARARQGEAARKAVALDPGSPESHGRLAQFYFEGGDRESACEERRTAAILASAPQSDCSWSHPTPRDFAHEVEVHAESVAQDPLSAIARGNLGVFLFAAGRLEDAKSAFSKALELNPDDSGAPLEIARILVAQRRYDEAYAASARLPEGPSRDHVLALLYVAPGHRAEADAALERLSDRRGSEIIDNIRLAEVYALRGMNDAAISTLQDYRNAINPAGETIYSQIWWHQQEMSIAPFLAPLRVDPRWDALMAEPP
jgi:TolB-like protein/DNA-binding winged helix-turn-helix (wHTH) protein/Tfp pilus assembly protein PilF